MTPTEAALYLAEAMRSAVAGELPMTPDVARQLHEALRCLDVAHVHGFSRDKLLAALGGWTASALGDLARKQLRAERTLLDAKYGL